MVFRISDMRCVTVVYTLGRIGNDSNDARVLQLAMMRVCLKPDVLIEPSRPIGHGSFDREERRFERFACGRVPDCPNRQSSIVACCYSTTITK